MWAIVEIMGHRVRPGRISDANVGGGVMLMIEHPTATDFDSDNPLIEYYSPSAIFAIRPCSEEQARAAAATYWRAERPETPALHAPQLAELVDDDYDDGVDF